MNFKSVPNLVVRDIAELSHPFAQADDLKAARVDGLTCPAHPERHATDIAMLVTTDGAGNHEALCWCPCGAVFKFNDHTNGTVLYRAIPPAQLR